ncbi:YfiR family protein [Coraliomargarita algicola]|uniref:YfiR family protein n=1 Tax=Coraliomargarita algicola TaxID=3092156 RepID=A0ABZ0RHG0_9BACT|nr:YfiR family protein [Coraliomargarita sp. J2-16]WPJ95591.1 YfiR family protein [Coraliomargarita sp. J2-16]
MIRTLQLQLCICALLAILPWGLHAQTVQEENLKAGYLVNFLEFIEWDHTNSKGHRIGVMNSASVVAKINAICTARKYKEHGKPITVTDFKQKEAIKQVDLLFIPRGMQALWPELVQLSEKEQIVLIGEEAGFLESGGLIQFVTTNNRLRFKINCKQAERLNIRMSSKLLSLAIELKR